MEKDKPEVGISVDFTEIRFFTRYLKCQHSDRKFQRNRHEFVPGNSCSDRAIELRPGNRAVHSEHNIINRTRLESFLYLFIYLFVLDSGHLL